MRPPFAYYGGKQTMAELIISLLPPHRVYIEPFFGSGAVLFAKPPAPIEIANDLDLNIWTFFEVLRTRPDELELACRLTPYHREEFARATLVEDLDDLERARRTWVRLNQSFVKSVGRQTGWSLTVNRSQSSSAGAWSRIERFAECAVRMQHVSWENCDGADLVDRMATSDDTVVYVDCPYLAETRRGRDRQRPGDYLHDMGEPEDHRRLATALKRTPATVVVSGYPSELYQELYAGWHVVDVATRVYASHSGTAGRGERTERLWINRTHSADDLFSTIGEVPCVG